MILHYITFTKFTYETFINFTIPGLQLFIFFSDIHHYSSTFGHGRRWKVASQVQWTEGAQQTQLERRNGDPGVPKIPGVPKSVEIFWLMSWEHLRTMFNMFKKGKNDVLKSEREVFFCFRDFLDLKSDSSIVNTWNTWHYMLMKGEHDSATNK